MDNKNYAAGEFDPNAKPADLPNHPSQPGHPNYPEQEKRNIQPPPAQPAYPSLPGLPISDEEHNFLKASREKRAQRWEELKKLAAEIGATVSGYPTPSHPPHVRSAYMHYGERPSGLTLDQEVENERYYDDTERNTLHREQEIKKTAAADAAVAEQKRHELERAKDRSNERKP